MFKNISEAKRTHCARLLARSLLPARRHQAPQQVDRSPFGHLALVASLLLCVAGNAYAYGPYNTPATSHIHNGDQVVLNQTISVPGGSKVYLQAGEVRTRSDIRQSSTYCYFHLYRAQSLLNSPAVVDAGTFSIDSAWNRLEYVLLDQKPLQVASGFISQDASQQTMVTRIKLRSPTQPEVMHLNCAIWAVPNERNHPSLEEVKQALGDVVTLRLSDG